MQPGLSHAFALAGLTNAFEMLRVSAAVSVGDRWRVIHHEPNVSAFESQHGVEERRDRYNTRCIRQAVQHGEPVRGEHAGLCDLFVPVRSASSTLGVLVSGPFATRRPSLSDVLERWQALTGRQGHLADPEFSDYLSVTLATLVLESKRVEMFERFLTHVSQLIAGEGDATALEARAASLRDRLEEARFVDRIWEAARSMLDERTEQSWLRPYRNYALSTMGLSRPADAVAVGLIVSRRSERDPVEELMEKDAFQRASMLLLRSLGEAISCKVGDHGIAILSARSGSRTRKHERLLELGEHVRKLGRRHGFDLFFGLSARKEALRLSSQYQGALVAAEAALSQGEHVADLDPTSPTRPFTVAELCRELCSLIEEQPLSLPARFDRYLEAVALHTGYRIDPARAHLETTFERLAHTLRDAGTLDPKSLLEICRGVSDAARDTQTVKELFAVYRRAAADLSRTTQTPGPAHQERSLGRAVAYIHDHFAEPLSLLTVSRIAGFAPNYFSRLFKDREAMTFARYLRNLRIERAKHLLDTGDLEVRRVARLSGFATATHFSGVFKNAVGTSPLAYRQRKARIKNRNRNV